MAIRGRELARPGIVRIGVALVAVSCILFVVIRELRAPSETAVVLDRRQTLLNTYPKTATKMLYKVVAEISLDMHAPRGVTTGTDGQLYVCGDRELLELDTDGTLVNRFRLPDAATCAVFDGDKRVYVGFERTVAAVMLETGEVRAWSDLDERAIITSITVAGEWVYVADAGNRAVYRYDRFGKLEDRIQGFIVPSRYLDAVGRGDGSVWITDPGRHTVSLYTSTGERLSSWGKPSIEVDGFPGCCNPTHLALLPDGSVVTSEKGIMRIKVFSIDGVFQGMVAAETGFPTYSDKLDITTDTEGRIITLVPESGTLIVYERNR